MDDTDERSIFPGICPVTGWGHNGFLGCAPSGCKYLAHTPVRRYLYCAHPDRDLDCFRKHQQNAAIPPNTASSLTVLAAKPKKVSAPDARQLMLFS